MIRLSDPDAALIISRGKMQDGDELASQVEQQMKKLEKQVKELRYTPAQVVRLGIDGKMEGLEIQSQFIRGNEHVYQYQAVFVLQSSRVMMALTYARSTALTEADRGRWADIKKKSAFQVGPGKHGNRTITQGVWYGRSILGGKGRRRAAAYVLSGRSGGQCAGIRHQCGY
ncbi:hypothetical protein SEEH4316_01207 [Salmonella enterica subsp. enterica serovar Heidelberg str. RI-11-014316]|nr:hypothetical protein SEEH4316_01207 [Salmonella enterica subsp. enterica serovar Heidelberg str. RI-11-014316]